MSITLADVYLDNDAFAERVPHETFALMRREAPVHWYDWEYGKGFWCITRYDDLHQISQTHPVFSSEWASRSTKAPRSRWRSSG